MKPNQTKQQVKQQNNSITKINICLSWQQKTVPELMKSCLVDKVVAVDNGADVGELKTGIMKHVDESTSSNETKYSIIGPMM